jgi:ABC-type transport system involved in cytochrome bd biosynthesis fused ATPase/permease subunit
VLFPSCFLCADESVLWPADDYATLTATRSAKSTFLSAILGHARTLKGQVRAPSRVSYVAQQPWILNMTIRDNILFGAEMDEAKYARVLDACCLSKHMR